MSDFLDLQGAKDLNVDAIHIGAVANSVDPVTGAAIDTHVNRVGGTDYTLDGLYKALGPVVMPWTSVAGGTLTQPNQAFLHPVDGNYYSWGGEYPASGYVVAPGTDPTAVAGYVSRTDVVLRLDLASESGSELVGYQPAGNGAVATTVQSKLLETVSVKDFGADPTGAADSGPAFRKAAAYIESIGGGVIGVPPGLYRCASVDPDIDWPRDERHVVYLGSNTVLQGSRGAVFWLDGATLSGQSPFTSGIRFNCVAIKKGGKYSAVSGLRFTTNGWVLDIAFRTCVGVTVGGDECQVTDNFFDNMPGPNLVYVGYNYPSWPAYNYMPQGVVIENNTFVNGSKNVPGNTVADDCSFVYINSYNTTVIKNRFYNTAAPVTYCGGVEMHGSRIKVEYNEFTNLQPAIYTGFGNASGVSQGNTVTGNTIISCAGGVQTIDAHDGLVISDNTFLDVLAMSQTKSYGTAIYSTLNGTTGVSGGVVSGAKISRNHIRESTPISKSAIAIGGLQSSIISQNTFNGVSSPIQVCGASDAVTYGVDVCDNIIVNPVTNPAYSTGAVSVAGGDTYTSYINNVLIKDNILLANEGATNTGIVVAAGTGTTLSNVVVTGNKVVNASDVVLGAKAGQVIFEPDSWSTHTCAWTQTSGTQPSLGNGSISFAYRRTGKQVTVWFYFYAGSATTFGNSSTAWRFSLPVAASSSFSQQNGIMEVASGSDMYICGLTIGGGESTFMLNHNSQSVRLDYPFVSVPKMVIRGQFSYLTA